MMKKYLSFLFSVPLLGLALFGGGMTQAADCTAIGQRVAADQGGQLTKATQVQKKGRDTCVVVVIVPGKNGEKPRRVERAVPVN